MKKLLLLFCALLCLGVSEGWAAVTVTIANSNTKGPMDYGTGLAKASGHQDFNPTGTVTLNTTWTSGDDSGLAGLRVSTSNATLFAQDDIYSSKALCLHLTAAKATETVTIEAPSGYFITGYTFEAASWNSTENYDVKYGGTTKTTSNSSWTTCSLNNIASNSTSFTVTGKATDSNRRYLIIRNFSITLEAYDSEVTAAKAAITPGSVYRIFTYENGSGTGSTKYYLTPSGYLTSTRPEAGIFTFTASTASSDVFVPAGYAWQISADGTNYFSNPEKSDRDNHIHTSDAARQDWDAQIFYLKDGKYAVRATNAITEDTWGSNTFWKVDEDDDDSGLPDADYGLSGDKYYIWQIEQPTSVSVTYNILDADGNIVAYTTVSNYVGAPPAVPSSIAHAYCTYGSFYENNTLSGDAVTEITAATTLYTQLSVSPSSPVTFSTAEAPVYYYLKLRDRYLYAADADATYPSIQNDIKSTKEGAWAFIGNPYSFKIINKVVGTGKFLARNTSVSSGAANGTIFNITGTAWQMNPHYLGNGFRIYDPSTSPLSHIYTNNTNLMWLSWDGTSSDSNGGGRFVPTPYSDDFTSQVTANIKPYFTKYAASGEVYFGITTVTNTSYASTVTTRESSCTEDQYEELLGNVMAGIKYPTTGYYRLKNNSTSNYLGYESSLTGTLSSTAAASVAYLNSSSNGVFSILLQGGKYVQMPSGLDVAATTSSTPMNFTATIVAPGVVSLLGPGASNAFQNFGVSGSSIVGQQGSSATAQWILEDATSFSAAITNAKDNTGTEHSYATLCVPFAISTLTGANAYMPTKDGDYIVPGNAAEVSEGTLIPAGTPVLLVGAKDAGTYTATIKTDTAPASSPATTNVLTGTFTGTTIDCTAETTNYVLGFDEDNDNRIGFYHVANAAEFPLSANRAYLKLDGSGDPIHVKGFAISFDDELVDGIGLAPAPSLSKRGEEAIFNLAGQRLSRVQKGVNIVNGQKVLVK